MKKVLACLLMLCGLLSEANAQWFTAEKLETYKDWPHYSVVKQFYEARGWQPAWIGHDSLQKELLTLLHESGLLALNEGDYQQEFMSGFYPERLTLRRVDSTETELRFTDAALHFFSELKVGNKSPSLGYNGLPSPNVFPSIASGLQVHLLPGGLYRLADDLQPHSAAYKNALQLYNRLLQTVRAKGFDEAKIVSSKTDSTNKVLLRKLYLLGFTDTVENSITKNELQKRIKEAQTVFDLLSDGILRSTTLSALNIPLSQRMEELKAAVNLFRWTEVMKDATPVLFVNIPSANFFLYDGEKLLLESRVIAGKPSTHTPTLASTINEVILYPYWNVPNKIATRELLPGIKKNIRFLELGNFQVLDKKGRVLNPYHINWRSLNANNFPYVIRQSTGCDNALGFVKFNFSNPFTVYLHDTPGKILFSSSRRFYSHGCMRVEKPEDLAHYLLGSNRIAIDTLTVKGCINQQVPVVVKAEKPLPVVVLYSTVWHTAEGSIRFYNDVYNKLNFIKAAAYNP